MPRTKERGTENDRIDVCGGDFVFPHRRDFQLGEEISVGRAVGRPPHPVGRAMPVPTRSRDGRGEFAQGGGNRTLALPHISACHSICGQSLVKRQSRFEG